MFPTMRVCSLYLPASLIGGVLMLSGCSSSDDGAGLAGSALVSNAISPLTSGYVTYIAGASDMPTVSERQSAYVSALGDQLGDAADPSDYVEVKGPGGNYIFSVDASYTRAAASIGEACISWVLPKSSKAGVPTSWPAAVSGHADHGGVCKTA